MLEIQIDVAAANVRRHGNDRSVVKPPNQTTSRDSVKVGHDDVHQNEVIFGSALDFVDCLQTVELGILSEEVRERNAGHVTS